MTTHQPAALPEHTIGKHDHPEPHTMCWSDLELGAIKRYAESYALAALQSQPAALSEPALLGAIARGWCHPKNSGKEVDADLAAAIASEILSINPAQPAAAEVSDAELLAAYNSIDPCNESPTDRLIRRLRAILALRPQAVPMSADKMIQLLGDRYDGPTDVQANAFYNGLRAAEAHHGITAQGAQGEQG